MEIKPIKSQRDHDQALREIERLWGAPARTPRGNRLEVLMTLVDAYERAHCPVDPPDSLAAIRFRLEQQGLSPKALIGVIGSRSRVYEVLRGARPLSLAMIRRLHERFAIPAEVLIRPVTKRSRRAA
jgi:HTH-type transcriptional regulator / antitoxin HigA